MMNRNYHKVSKTATITPANNSPSQSQYIPKQNSSHNNCNQYPHPYFSKNNPSLQSLKDSTSQKSTKIIKLTGDINQRIPQIIGQIGCCSNCQFQQIMRIFGDKINKLRHSRDVFKQKYVDDVYNLQSRIKYLEQENKQLKKMLGIQIRQKNSEQQQNNPALREIKDITNRSQFQRYQQYLGITKLLHQPKSKSKQSRQEDQQSNFKYQNQQSTLCEIPNQKQCNKQREKQTQKQQKNKENLQNISKIVLKYNISNQQLQQSLAEYFIMEPFSKSNKKLRQLYEKLIQEKQRKQIKRNLGFKIKNKSKQLQERFH